MRKRQKIALSLLLAAGTGFQIVPAPVFAVEMHADETNMIEETISFRKTDGESNKFTYASNAWEAGGDEHRWSKAPSDSLPASDIWYQVDFVGNAIEVYSGKNHPMGMVEYFIDGVSQGKFSLYNNGNINKTKIAKFENLTEGPHTFKAVATGERDTNSTNSLIDCSDVVITHVPYVITAITPAQNTLTLGVGAAHPLEMNVTPSYAGGTLSYSSSNANVASVSEDGVVTAVSKGTAEITISSESVSAKVAVEVVDTMTEIGGSIVDTNRQYTQNKYAAVKDMATLNAALQAWKGDTAVSQLVVFSKDCALKNVTVSASDFTDGKGHTIAASNVKTQFILSTKAYNGSFLGYGSTTRPVPEATETNRSESSDILSNASSVNVEYNHLQPVWVEASVPADAAAGSYTGKITVNADDLDEPMEFIYTLNVQDATLGTIDEMNDEFDLELWQYPYTSAEYYNVEPFSDAHFKILKPIMEMYKQAGGHAITTTISEDAWSGQTYSANDVHYPSMVKWTKEADGSFSYDFTAFDKWVTFCRNEIGIGDKIVLYSIAPWHSSFTYWENGVLKREVFTAGSARYNEVWGHFLNALVSHLMDKGWFDDAYLGIDERGFSAAAFDLIESVKNIHTKSLKTAGAMDGFINKRDLAMRVDDLNVGDNAAAAHPAEFAQLLKDRTAAGKRTTLYSCTEHSPGNFSLSAPTESYWTVVNAGKETAGFLRWAYDAWVADPLRDTTHNAFEPGDCFLIYPDEKDSENPQAQRSLRLARMMEAMRDVNKLRTIEKEVPSLKGQIDALYADVETTAGTSHSYLSDAQVTSIADEMDTFKAGIAALTETYIERKASGTTTVTGVEITSNVNSMKVGSTVQLSAAAKPDNLLDNRIDWSSSNPLIATIDENGNATALQPGSVTFTATSKADPMKKAEITIEVVRTAIPVESLLNAFPFEDSLEDAQGDRDGSSESTLIYEAGRSGKAVRLAAGEGIALSGTTSIGESDPWSLTYWVKADTITGKSLITQDATKTFATAIKMADNRASGYRTGTGNGDVLTMAYDFQPNQWYHVSWTNNKTDGIKLYVNGTHISTNAWTASHRALLPGDIIGMSDFAGLVDELHIYNRVLTSEEIQADMSVPGLTIAESSKTITTRDTFQIQASLVSDEDGDSVVYTSLTPELASVSATGLVTPLKEGIAKIRIASKSGLYSEEVTVTIEKYLVWAKKGPYYDLPEKYQSTVHFSEDTSNQYFGQPDMVRTKTGRLITAFPQGHGHGPLIMKYSDDDGETWIQKNDIPESWARSQETPTMYKLTLADGTERIIMICACPTWDLNLGGWNTSYSDDNGETWTEFDHFHSTFPSGNKRPTIVAMASLVQLRDEEGNPIQKWMGVFHDYSYVNYKTYLTFDENGNEQWSEPEAFLSEYRSIESSYQMCEIGMFRSPDGKRIVGLARSQSHNNPSTMIYSDDEGETWSKPLDLPGNLSGERHKAIYDPISGRLFITFRDIKFDLNGNNQFDGANDWTCGEWTAWVGTYEDLMNREDGDYLINLDYDYANNHYSGDTGYSGLVTLDDGTIIANTYGHWDQEYSENWTGGVTTDRCYIRQVKFKLGEFENDMDLVDKTALSSYIENTKPATAGKPAGVVQKWNDTLKKASDVLASRTVQQCEVDQALEDLKAAFDLLEKGLDISALEATILMTDALNASAFDADALKAVQGKADAFRTILNAPETQKQIDDAASELNQALLALRRTPSRAALDALK